MNKPVKYELAKLLKEKGFNELCSSYYLKSDIAPIETNVKCSNNRIAYSCCTAPTIAEVLMWLYEKHGIWISVDMVFEEHQTGFWYCIRESKDTDHAITSDEYSSPNEAYEAAIQYCLNNLID